MIDYSMIMTRALRLRKELGEDSESPLDIFALTQQIDRLTLVFYPMGDRLSGICLKSANGNVIAINSGMTVGRQRFSMAHELYHLYFDDNMSAFCAKKIGDGTDIEKEADVFASYFLMPPAAFCEKVEEFKGKNLQEKNGYSIISFRDVIRIEQYFGVSHHAVIVRLQQQGFIPAHEASEFMMRHVKYIAETMGYNGDLYLPLPKEKQYMTYGHYIVQAQKIYNKELISQGKYEELLMDAFRADLVYGDVEEGGDMLD